MKNRKRILAMVSAAMLTFGSVGGGFAPATVAWAEGEDAVPGSDKEETGTGTDGEGTTTTGTEGAGDTTTTGTEGAGDTTTTGTEGTGDTTTGTEGEGDTTTTGTDEGGQAAAETTGAVADGVIVYEDDKTILPCENLYFDRTIELDGEEAEVVSVDVSDSSLLKEQKEDGTANQWRYDATGKLGSAVVTMNLKDGRKVRSTVSIQNDVYNWAVNTAEGNKVLPGGSVPVSVTAWKTHFDAKTREISIEEIPDVSFTWTVESGKGVNASISSKTGNTTKVSFPETAANESQAVLYLKVKSGDTVVLDREATQFICLDDFYKLVRTNTAVTPDMQVGDKKSFGVELRHYDKTSTSADRYQVETPETLKVFYNSYVCSVEGGSAQVGDWNAFATVSGNSFTLTRTTDRDGRFKVEAGLGADKGSV